MIKPPVRLMITFLLVPSHSLLLSLKCPFNLLAIQFSFASKVMPSSAPSTGVASAGPYLIYVVVGLVVQTFFFGVYTTLVVLSTRMLRKRGLKTRANNTIFIMTVLMYLLSAAYWTYSVADAVDRMRVYIDVPLNSQGNHDTVTKWSPLFNALPLVNYIMSDAVVVWRAWILCLRSHRRYLWITIGFLLLTAISVVATIIFQIIALVKYPIDQVPNGSYLAEGINILQMSNLTMSLISNISATAVVGATAWHHRKTIRAAFADNKKNTKADQILSLVVESGILYCISGLTVLISSLIRLPHGTLGDIYTPVNVQIAGAYPSVVLLLVSMQRSLSETTFLNTFDASAPSRPMQFADSGPRSENHGRDTAVSIQFARDTDPSRTELGTDAILGSDMERMVYENSREKTP
ncbi:hypothetical protein B0H11DRAFT_2001031 [Mycena galericulata]|nr:hypothetical protein B0H11DRAFT_2001031 [Mycena galericulata]